MGYGRIAYNTTMVDEPVDSWNILWDPKYEGNILMMDIGIPLPCPQKLGYSLNSRNEAELEQAKEGSLNRNRWFCLM